MYYIQRYVTFNDSNSHLKYSQNSLEKKYQSLFFNKLQSWSLQHYYKRDSNTVNFPWILQIFKNVPFTEHLWATVSLLNNCRSFCLSKFTKPLLVYYAKKIVLYRSSSSQKFSKIGVLKNFAEFTGITRDVVSF